MIYLAWLTNNVYPYIRVPHHSDCSHGTSARCRVQWDTSRAEYNYFDKFSGLATVDARLWNYR